METVKDYGQYFEVKTRNEGGDYIAMKDSTPNEVKEELKSFIFEVHQEFGGCLPNDWLYLIISEAFEMLEEENIDEVAIEADPYYKDLYTWFGEPYAHELCQKVIEEGISEINDVYNIIATAQYLAKRKIYGLVWDFMGKDSDE